MNSVRTPWLLPALFALTACLDTATNKEDILPPITKDDSPSGSGDEGSGDGTDDDGASDDRGDTSGDDTSGDDTSGGDTSGDDTSGGDTSGGDTSGGDEGDGGDSGDGGDGGDDGPAMSQISGTADAANCLSYTAQTANTCYGYYCGISEETLASELSASRKCDYPVEDACAGLLSAKVGACARMAKTQNPFISEADHRTKTAECVYGDQHLKDTVAMDCLDCYLTAAMCASKNCVAPCLQGDTPACDQCRMDNNCNQPVPGCAGLPSPF